MRDVARLMVIAAVGCLGLAAAGETAVSTATTPCVNPGQPVNQFQFAGIDKAAVQEVLLTSSTGRCFVIGPTGS